MDFDAGHGAFSEDRVDTPIDGAPNIIPSYKRERPLLMVMGSGGGAWGFFHYGLYRQLLVDMLVSNTPLEHAHILLFVGTSAGSIPAYLLSRVLNGPGDRTTRLVNAIKMMDLFNEVFTYTANAMGENYRKAMMNPRLAMAVATGDKDFQLRWAIEQALTETPGNFNDTHVLLGATRLKSGGIMIPEHFVDERATIDAVIASCAVMGLFKGIPDGEDLLIDGGYTENPPLLSALNTLGIDKMPKNGHVILSLTECTRMPEYDETSMLTKTVPTRAQRKLLGNSEIKVPRGFGVTREILRLRDFAGEENITTCAMFSKKSPRGLFWTSATKGMTIPNVTQSCRDRGVVAGSELTATLNQRFAFPADKYAPA